jgi:hypothetical protein
MDILINLPEDKQQKWLQCLKLDRGDVQRTIGVFLLLVG